MDSLEINKIQIGDYTFEKFWTEKDIARTVELLAARICADYDNKNPLFIVVLSGAFIFAADLMRYIDMDHDISFVKVKSYEGMESSGKLDIQLPLDINVSDRHLILIEDIVDSGNTLFNFTNYLNKLKPHSIEIVSLLHKPDSLTNELRIRYIGKEIPSEFVIGYGLDYNGKGRNLRHIYKLDNSNN